MSGCASQETKQNRKIYSSSAGVELVKKGFNPFFQAYGHSRQEAIQEALAMCEVKRKEIGEGRCRVYWNCNARGYECGGGSKAYVTPQQKKEKKAQATLDDIKSTCMTFGYKEGSEKLADCMKDLYVKHSQAGTAKRKIDPTVWDDLLKMGGVKSGSSTSTSSSSTSMPKGTCYNTGEETGGLNKSCKYSCSGNIVTITISALEICPLHIQR